MKYLTDERVFGTSHDSHMTVTRLSHDLCAVVLYAVSAVYFAGVMVRLMLTLTPIVCILASIAISHSLDNYMKPVFSSKDGEWIGYMSRIATDCPGISYVPYLTTS